MSDAVPGDADDLRDRSAHSGDHVEAGDPVMFGSLVAASTVGWLIYIGLYEHDSLCVRTATARCPTIYGFTAPLDRGQLVGTFLMIAGFALPALWVGWRRSVPPATAGVALALGPTVLALWTAPRGDNDGLWVAFFLYLPLLGGAAAGVVAIVGGIRRAFDAPVRTGPDLTMATSADRLGALVIDAIVIGAVLVVPVTALSNRKHEALAVIGGVAFAAVCLAVPLAWKGHTLGHWLMGLVVQDVQTRRPVPIGRALLRSLVVASEVAAAATLVLAAFGVLELVSLDKSGRTYTDRLVRTVVLRERR